MLKLLPPLIALYVLLAGIGPAATLLAQSQEEATVEESARVLSEIMSIPAKQIPQALLADAQGLAIVPNIVKGGFVVGVRYGRGVVVVRDGTTGAWRPPTFVTLTGGSLGWQAGIQASDLILVFKTQKSVQGLMRGKFTIGADAAAAAGPVGRQAAAATDAQLGAEILSYSRSRGLFAGVALDGTAIQIDGGANQAFYGNTGFNPANPSAPMFPANAALPQSAVRLLSAIAQYTSGAPTGTVAQAAGPVPPANMNAAPASAAAPAAPDLGVVRAELAQQSQQLLGLLDDNWKRFLALPQEIVTGQGQVSAAALTEAINRYETVMRDPQYQALTQRPEFRATLELLRRYREFNSIVSRPLPFLPAPPSTPQTGAAPGTLPRY